MESITTLAQLGVDEISQLREQAKESLYFFAKGILGFKDLTPHIHKPLCDMLQQVSPGARHRIILPRGWFKTTVCTIAYSVWRAIRDPNIRILLAQNTATNAEAKLRSIRGIFESNDLFKALFPELLPTKDCIWTKNSLCINRTNKQHVESTFEAVGVNTQVVSRHYDIIIEDDTVAPDLNELGEESLAPSKADIGQAIGWHRLATPLLVDIGVSEVLVVGTRWFELDLLSWIGKNEPHYSSYVRACREDDSGASSPTGNITFPERFNEKILGQLETALGPYMFACLYLNNPMRSGDMIFQLEWFHEYHDEPKGLDVYTTVDLAGNADTQKGSDTDYNVILTTGKHPKTGRIYVLDYWRQRGNPGQVLDALFERVKIYHPLKVGVEGIAYQNTFEFWAKERMRSQNTYFFVEELKKTPRSKNEKIQGLQPLFAAGSIFIRNWMTSLRNELVAFPLGTHDDLADCLSMQLEFWNLTDLVTKHVPDDTTENPLSFDAAVEEILARKTVARTIVDDVLSPEAGYASAFLYN